MASVPHRLEERATVPRIVLPITSRGLEVTDRVCWVILAAAMAAAAGLILYLNRGTIFNADELVWVLSSPSLGASDVLEPYNGNLIATTRLAYKAILETFGAGYVPFRLLGVSAVLLSAGAFYALAKRRIGALPALAPSLVLLFFGSAGDYAFAPIGTAALLSIAAGLAALLALERDDRRGDVAACALMALSVATFTTGLAFLVGVAISVLIRPDRRRRAWIFAVPLVLYAAWWLWALDSPGSSESDVKLSNALLIPNYVADGLAAATAALAGLSFDYTGGEGGLGWGTILAVLAAGALATRIRRGSVPPSLWVSLGIALAFWAAGALAFLPDLRVPDSSRYLYMGAVAVLLVATDAARRIRFSTLGLAALFAACAISLATNIALLRDGAAALRNGYSTPARAQFTALELARGEVESGFTGLSALTYFREVAPAGPYFEVLDEYGSLGFSLTELEDQSVGVRESTDKVLARALDLSLDPSATRQRVPRCDKLRAEGPNGAIGFELPAGGASLSARGEGPAPVTLGRFGPSPSVEVGSLSPGETADLRAPTDPSPTPWQASVTGARSVEVCALR
jgi:hypothetical protein